MLLYVEGLTFILDILSRVLWSYGLKLFCVIFLLQKLKIGMLHSNPQVGIVQQKRIFNINGNNYRYGSVPAPTTEYQEPSHHAYDSYCIIIPILQDKVFKWSFICIRVSWEPSSVDFYTLCPLNAEHLENMLHVAKA